MRAGTAALISFFGISILSLPALRDTFEVNLFSIIETAAWFCAPGGKRSLVLISSMGRWHGMHSSCGYNASKAALSIWAESLELELGLGGKRDARVMVVEPGLFESGMVERKGLNRWLIVTRRDLAERIFHGALKGRKTVRYPSWFTGLTWMVLAAGRGFRRFLFARAKE